MKQFRILVFNPYTMEYTWALVTGKTVDEAIGYAKYEVLKRNNPFMVTPDTFQSVLESLRISRVEEVYYVNSN